ncbi:MAG: hypothetical protein IBJ11_10410 [Phycisphaerales bacterium]|nr:hypothetical protein [Phycisphaerales bacterium]
MTDRVALFYEQHLGLYPRLWDGRPENGGIPQKADLEAHLAKVRSDVEKAIPDPNWSGLAIIDFEAWPPQWKWLLEPYREMSRQMVRQRQPDLPAAEVERLSAQWFESSARNFMIRTIRAARAARPKALWGFYHFVPKEEDLEPTKWMAAEVDAVFASVYATHMSLPGIAANDSEQPEGWYAHRMSQTVDLARRWAPGKPVYAMIMLRYWDVNKAHAYKPLNDADLATAIGHPRACGAAGTIIWDVLTKPGEAGQFDEQLRTRVAPAIRRTQQD